MCDLVQEYAEEYAKEYVKECVNREKIKMLVELFNDGMITSEAVMDKLGITEEKFLDYVEEYSRQKI